MSAKQNEKRNGKSQISGWNLACLKFKGVKAIWSPFKSLSALMDQILHLLWSHLVRLELTHHFQCRVPTQEQLTFRSLTDEMFIFLATFGDVLASFKDFDAFIFINNSRHVEPLDRIRNVKRFSIVPYIFTHLMPISQPNPNRSAVCVLESHVMDKLHFLFIRYAYQGPVSRKSR